MKFDVLIVVLVAVAAGLAFLPVCLIAGADSSAIIALGTAYGGIVAVVAPMVGKANRTDDRRDDKGRRDGDDR